MVENFVKCMGEKDGRKRNMGEKETWMKTLQKVWVIKDGLKRNMGENKTWVKKRWVKTTWVKTL